LRTLVESSRAFARGLEHRDGERGFVVEQTAHAIGLRAQLDARDITEAHHLPVGAGLDDDVAELLLIREAPAAFSAI